MNEDKINELLDFLLKAMQDGKGFAIEQAPEVAREIINYGWWTSLIGTIASGAVLSFCAIVLFLVARYYTLHGNDTEDDFIISVSGFSSATFGIVSGVVFVPNVITLLQISVAPRMYVIEQLTTMIHRL